MWENNNVNQIFEESQEKKDILEQKALRRSFFSTIFAVVFWLFLLLLSIWSTIYTDHLVWSEKRKYDIAFWELKENRTKEVKSEIKQVITKIWTSSNLVYNLSLFHIPPKDILELVEKAIYLGPDEIITNENVSFQNYNTVSFWLVTQDLENYATLIKKLKKLYSDLFEVKGLQDFGISYEKDELGKKTWKVFYTTSLTLKYLKDPWSNLATKWVFEEDTTEDVWKYDSNEEAFETFKTLIEDLATTRKENNKTELYVTSTTEDDWIYLWTDTVYKNKNLYYITPGNPLTDLFDLNWIWTKEEYDMLKADNVKLLFITEQDWSKYWLCTKVPKKEDELTDLEKQNQTDTVYTKIISDWEIDSTIKNLCELL